MIDLQLLYESLPALLQGTVLTLELAALGCCIGFFFGTILGLLQAGKNKIIFWLITVYVTLIRGTPMLIQITFAFYVLPELGIDLSPFVTAVCAIGLNSSAYISQIIRSGVASVGVGQIEAARTIGLSTAQITQYIVLPQAIRIVLPALGNEFITLIKDSSLASIIGVYELYKQGSLIRSRTFDAITIYCAIALIYLILTTTLSILVALAQRKMKNPC